MAIETRGNKFVVVQPYVQTGVVSSSGASGIHEALEPPPFYQWIDTLTWKAENDKLYLVDHERKKVGALLDGYKPNREGYRILNQMIDAARGKNWAMFVPDAELNPGKKSTCRK